MRRAKIGFLWVILVATATWAGPPASLPQVVGAHLPLYPPIAWALHLTGAVKILVTVEKGNVVTAKIESIAIKTVNGGPLNEKGKEKVGLLLSTPSVANVKTWKFVSSASATFAVVYVYRIAGKPTALPQAPHVDFDLPMITVTAKPVKPTILYSGRNT